MDILQMFSELRAEHQQIEEAILVLQRVATGGGGKRRGRTTEVGDSDSFGRRFSQCRADHNAQALQCRNAQAHG
jgi:hypothetical protein